MRTKGDRLFEFAHRSVKWAIRHGLLAELDGSIPCTTCGQPATMYDHKDYRAPLVVEPVCRSCNVKRGPALPKHPVADDKTTKCSWFDGNAGMSWSAMDGGEGYSPLECVCRLGPDELAAIEGRIQDHCGGPNRDGRNVGWASSIARYEYFKRHDPWRA